MTRTAIELRTLFADPQSAGKELRTLLAQRKGHEDIRALIKHEPGTALAALQMGDAELGLGSKASADVLESVIQIVDDDEAVKELMQLHLTPDRRAELLAGRSNLPSAAVTLATPDDLIRAIRLEMQEDAASGGAEYDEVSTGGGADDDDDEDETSDEEDEEEEAPEPPHEEAPVEEIPEQPTPSVNRIYHTNARAMFSARAWALKIHGRPDYESILELPLVGRRPLRSYVICAVWYEAGRPSDLEEVTGDLFVDVGIDPYHGREELRRLLDGDDTEDLVSIDDEVLHEAAVALTRAREAREQTPEVAQDAARRKAGALDF